MATQRVLRSNPKWMGSTTCDICGRDARKVGQVFYDAPTRMGPWALMCADDYKRVGVPGSIGQVYDSNTLEKVTGGGAARKVEDMIEKPAQTLTFEQWKRKVNAIIMSKIGLGADDLPDWDYRIAYDDGMSPRDAAQEVIEEAAGDMGFDADDFFDNPPNKLPWRKWYARIVSILKDSPLFKTWQVNMIRKWLDDFEDKLGVSYRGMWEEGLTPPRAVMRILEALENMVQEDDSTDTGSVEHFQQWLNALKKGAAEYGFDIFQFASMDQLEEMWDQDTPVEVVLSFIESLAHIRDQQRRQESPGNGNGHGNGHGKRKAKDLISDLIPPVVPPDIEERVRRSGGYRALKLLPHGRRATADDPVVINTDNVQIAMTPGAAEALNDLRRQPFAMFARFVRGDWGDLDKEDWDTNNHALLAGERVLASYTIDAVMFWIIMERGHEIITLLLAEEY